MILVTGATGTIGSEVVKQLVETGQPVRVLVRDPAKVQQFGDRVQVAIGDLEKPETLTAAFAGVDKAFILTVGPDTPRLEANAYEAAKSAGVKHLVKLSGGGVGKDFMAGAPGAAWHAESEQRLRTLGLAWTILQPAPFTSNVIKLWKIKENGGLFLPTGGGKDAPIDPRDVAAVAVKALTTPGHEGKTYQLTGPELLSNTEVVQKISAATGRPLKFENISEAAARQNLVERGFPPPLVETFMVYFAAVRAGCFTVTSAVPDVLGRPARTFDEWIRDHATELQ